MLVGGDTLVRGIGSAPTLFAVHKNHLEPVRIDDFPTLLCSEAAAESAAVKPPGLTGFSRRGTGQKAAENSTARLKPVRKIKGTARADNQPQLKASIATAAS